MDDQRLIAFLSLTETTKEHFYFYVFVFDEGLHPYISAWSYKALEKSIIEQQIPDEKKVGFIRR